MLLAFSAYSYLGTLLCFCTFLLCQLRPSAEPFSFYHSQRIHLQTFSWWRRGKLQQCRVGRGSGECSFSSSFRLVVLIIGISKSRAAISCSFQGFCYVCQVGSQFSKPCWSGIWLSHLPLVHLLSPSKILLPSPFLFSLTLFIHISKTIHLLWFQQSLGGSKLC